MALYDAPIIGNIMKAIAELMPGEQPFLGEIGGGLEGLLGAPGAALAALIPGTQPWEARRPPRAYVKTWYTGTVAMFLMEDGKIGCYKKNGVWKEWRPAKHIVVPRNPRIGTLINADKRVDRLMRGLTRRLPSARKRRASTRVSLSAPELRAVERLLLTAGKS